MFEVPLPSLPDVSAIHSTTMSSSHIDETALSHRKYSSNKDESRRSSTETIYNMNNSTVLAGDLAPVKCDVLANTKVCSSIDLHVQVKFMLTFPFETQSNLSTPNTLKL